MKKEKKILIVNDDGYKSEGLRILADWASRRGEITVCAPKNEQSGKSHGINIHDPFEARRVDLPFAAEVWSVDSTPADCVRFAVNGLHRSFDLVLSGINRGINVGRDILYSGTVGAIFEAEALGIPAIAISTEPDSFSFAKECLDEIFDFIESNRMLDRNWLYNVNIPCRPACGIRVTRQAGPYYLDRIEPCGEDMFRQIGYSSYQGTADLSLDLDAVMNGYISITPMTIERTHTASYEHYKNVLYKE